MPSHLGSELSKQLRLDMGDLLGETRAALSVLS